MSGYGAKPELWSSAPQARKRLRPHSATRRSVFAAVSELCCPVCCPAWPAPRMTRCMDAHCLWHSAVRIHCVVSSLQTQPRNTCECGLCVHLVEMLLKDPPSSSFFHETCVVFWPVKSRPVAKRTPWTKCATLRKRSKPNSPLSSSCPRCQHDGLPGAALQAVFGSNAPRQVLSVWHVDGGAARGCGSRGNTFHPAWCKRSPRANVPDSFYLQPQGLLQGHGVARRGRRLRTRRDCCDKRGRGGTG